MSTTSLVSQQAVLAERLQARQAEIEQTVLARVYSVADPSEGDPEYVAGLRAAVEAAVGYGLLGIERGEDGAAPPPAALLLQARHAARNGVSLETVLRRYVAGYALLGDFILQEAEKADLLGRNCIQRVQRTHTVLFDRLLVAISEEHARELSTRPATSERRQVEQVKRLLAGELVDTLGFRYDFNGHHIAVIATGPDAPGVLRDLAARFDRSLLLIRPAEEMTWAWFGGRQVLSVDELIRCAQVDCPLESSLALGEPGQGMPGWRLTHRQAAATSPIAMRGAHRVVRYGDVALLASVLQDETLISSLRELYLAPLAAGENDSAALHQTLRAYFAAERNVSSTAIGLGVNRNTVANRLRAIEERLGRPIGACAAELDAALQLQEFESWTSVHIAQGPSRR
jgi:PucR C-terminal helix-turn-helix domain